MSASSLGSAVHTLTGDDFAFRALIDLCARIERHRRGAVDITVPAVAVTATPAAAMKTATRRRAGTGGERGRARRQRAGA